MNDRKIIHLLPNAHLDPVWLWDWREGESEAVATAQSVLSLMERYPELTFVRGEAWFYETVACRAPELFERIRAQINAGRWDVVGGNYVQTDSNLPSTPTFLEQFRRGTEYFRKTFGIDVSAGWSPDCAGHAAGLPDLLAFHGIRYYAFGRPDDRAFPLENPAFFWRGPGGAEILAVREGYSHERGNILDRLATVRKQGAELPQRNLPLFIGLGDHGGGPSARIVEELLDAAETFRDDVEIRFSTLTGFFRALEGERLELPVVRGELNFALRGVSFANAPVKHRFRDLEAAYRRATRTYAAVGRALGLPAPDVSGIRDAVLFNTFHDILPGDGVESGDREQLAWMDGGRLQADRLEHRALAQLAAELDMPIPPPTAPDEPAAVPFLVFNPSTRLFRGCVRLESQLDYRPVWEWQDRPDGIGFAVRDETGIQLPAQLTEVEHCYFRRVPWRIGLLIPLEIPPLGFRRISVGKAADRLPSPPSPVTAEGAVITNGLLSVRIEDNAVRIERASGESVGAARGIRFAVFRDRFGCWGGMAEEPEAWTCPEKLEEWAAGPVKILENGPERAMLFVSFSGGGSRLDLRISLERGDAAAEFDAVLLWQERDRRLRMLLDPVAEATYQVPGGVATRSVTGDVPGGRWLKTEQFGFASDHLSGFSSLPEAFCVNLVKGSIFCTDELDGATRFPERPISDLGKHNFRFALTPEPELAPALADRLEFPPRTLLSWPHCGRKMETALEIQPECVELQTVEWSDGKLKAVLQNSSREPVDAAVAGKSVRLPPWGFVRMEL